jgi:hypothetical protein
MVQRRGQSPLIVYLTDGSGNIALDGGADRARARDDAQMLARQGAALGYRSILIDISRRPREATRDLARSMQAQYCPLAKCFGQCGQRHRQRRAAKGRRAMSLSARPPDLDIEGRTGRFVTTAVWSHWPDGLACAGARRS